MKNRKKNHFELYYSLLILLTCRKFQTLGYMYNSYVKIELYEIDLWTKLRKNHKN